MLTNVLSVALALIIITFTYFKWIFNYWKKKNVPYLEPTIPFGNVSNPIKASIPMALDVAKIYHKMKSYGKKYCGFYLFNDPVYMPIDPEYIKSVLVRDFAHFMNHGVYHNEKDDPLSGHLFAIEDEKWRHLRVKLTPTFTSGKLKTMFPTLVDCSIPLQEEIKNLNGKGEDLDVKELIAKYTTDVIGNCAFGIECNSFKDPDAEFRKYGRKAFEIRMDLKVILFVTCPNFSRKIGVRANDKEVSNFFLKMVKETVEFREKNNFRRNDFMQLLIDLKNNGEGDTALTLNELSAQAFVFFLAGFETSSTTLSYCLYELSKKQEVQDKVREEILTVLDKHGGKVTYDAVQDMKYVEQALNETLRMYPPVAMIMRMCNKDYVIPETDTVIKKGTRCLISAYGIQRDSEFYPNPEDFNPDRFSEENKDKIPHCTFLPFGEGPRICIGLRFGMLQAKVGLIAILKNHKITLSPKTPKTLTMDPSKIILTNKETIYLQSTEIK